MTVQPVPHTVRGGAPQDERLLLQRYPQHLTPHLERLLVSGGAGVARQFLADPAELVDDPDLYDDPLAEQRFTPLPGLVHRHPDRALLLASDACAATCRFCFRKGRRLVSYAQLLPAAREALFAYLSDREELREVILTGGDPLMLDGELLAELLQRLRGISHLETLRLHTRLPVVAPERITPQLLERLRGSLPLYVMLHVNHPAELTSEFAEACQRLVDAGFPLGSQTVLLKGVNDSRDQLAELFRGLLRLRVRPYYLHHPDLTRGTGHFRVSLERGQQVYAGLSASLSGLALPRYVIDLPGGLGKVPLGGDALVSGGDYAVLRTAGGEAVRVFNREG